ncbi:MAG: hydroxyacid dehydrogenase [Bacteroidetes bacterium]|nr:MAG: hydroxyacid dehydrogenase [Bacteroidota bacterium]
MTKPNCIVTAHCHPWLLDQLNKTYTVAYEPLITYEQLLARAPLLVGLVVTTRLQIDKRLIDAAPGLRWIGRLGSGLELIDVAYAETKGIRVASSPEGNRNAVAEQALGMLLGVMNKLFTATAQVKTGQWIRSENRGIELRGKTVGIVGYGNTGSQFAKLLQPFDVTVLAYDLNRYGFANGYIKEASVAQICRYAQVISFHVPLNAHSKHMANQQLFAEMQQQPIIVNTSRGGVVHTAHLLAALDQGLVSGACLDVLENEKLHTYTPEEQQVLQALLNHPAVVVTPHIAGYSHEAFLGMAQVLVQKLFETPALTGS